MNIPNPFAKKEGDAVPPDAAQQPELAAAAVKKTTSDEGKEFDKEAVFVCVQDCWQGNRRYRRGDEVAGRKCPPWFIVKPAAEEKKKQ